MTLKLADPVVVPGGADARHDDAPRAGIGSGITIENVTKRYGAFVAADRISLDIQPGEFVTLLGPSGSGKTTLLNLLAGFQRVDGGEIRVDGKRVQNVPVHKRGFGMVFQSYALFPNMTVAQNVGFPMRMAGINRADTDRRVAETLGMMQLSDSAAKMPSEMSGGQQQRVAIARSIVMRPKVVLMDEPLSALDRRLRESIQMEIRDLHRTIGSTFLFVTHDQSEALTMSDRIAVMDAGRIIQVDRPETIYRQPCNRFVAGFVGESNLIDAEIVRREGAALVLRTKTGHIFRSPAPEEVSGRNVTVLVRPERLILSDTPGQESIPARVKSALFLGEILRIEVTLDSGETLLVRCSDSAGQTLPAPGSLVHVSWGMSDGWVLA
ncbi:ABC transporter ATP-binding protein [Sulfitobacter pseudonitzschiae]|uniref:Spermidine/putrescine import ATP-binding protein PotA n=1 Tax=Pseudosulfitobacter pseudonitzschiae TaxID=1402135 RepID=A0A9Q2NXW0_9RHOB|nr:ABC transporter ATP-binding protein [Pseudosulfitobacter pseudonitzschiae]MBM2290676.1 ABC transporter ATP-binding protein [Pseudosulfitobacter pseudonitzschiae]MBM2295594.1 ABC transporter ATP-binding protein [Pseudosulfitobacter pseudonitzschiae]MBM2300506.1 ABC transporter ATP-binding protein [Pseudosulfitobacter pseudonitzschiae]MBM2310291.1 ABC transporter ATP-binding protein [Pseudosulfitobacter pseudonitzschiae]MBM2315203.1 ABC transporter ATP-binding protein [Pseudosulfitobacter pse